MRCIVFGTGSIGKRHIKNLRQILGKNIDIIAYKISRKDSEALERDFGVRIFYDLKEAFEQKPDFAIISSPTSLHAEQSILAAENGCHLFIEKPLSNDIKDIAKLEKIAKQKKLITFVAYCLRFSKPISEIKKLLDDKKLMKDLGKIEFAEVHVGTYLPDWHPLEDYSKSYSAKKELGGGVLLDLSHEIDYSRWLFGDLKDIKAASVSKISSLDIETEDTADIDATTDKKIDVRIHLDYIERPAKRFCRILFENGEIYWDNHANLIEIKNRKSGKTKKINVNEDWNLMYIREMEHFIDCVNKKKQTLVPLEDGKKALEAVIRAKKLGNWN